MPCSPSAATSPPAGNPPREGFTFDLTRRLRKAVVRSMPRHRMRRLLVALIGMPDPPRKVDRSSLSSDGGDGGVHDDRSPLRPCRTCSRRELRHGAAPRAGWASVVVMRGPGARGGLEHGRQQGAGPAGEVGDRG
jgi:hypothetical protein